jgi:hypothetical protein
MKRGVGYRYGRMCMRIEASGKRVAAWSIGVLLVGVAAGSCGTWFAVGRHSGHAYDHCVLDHMRSGMSRAAALQVVQSCHAIHDPPPPPDPYQAYR